MTQTLKTEPRFKITANRRQPRPLLGGPPEHILREIAFVLKMTERVRTAMDVERSEELVEA